MNGFNTSDQALDPFNVPTLYTSGNIVPSLATAAVAVLSLDEGPKGQEQRPTHSPLIYCIPYRLLPISPTQDLQTAGIWQRY